MRIGARAFAMTLLLAGCAEQGSGIHEPAAGATHDLPGVSSSEAQTAAERVVADRLDRLAEAWNRRDAAAWVRHFAEESSFTNILGMRFADRAANEARHALLFETIFAESRLEATVSSVRIFGGDAAVAEVEFTLRGYERLPPGIGESEPGLLRTRLVTVLDKRQGEWQIVAAQNTAIAPAALATNGF